MELIELHKQKANQLREADLITEDERFFLFIELDALEVEIEKKTALETIARTLVAFYRKMYEK